jgi:hypothetical protein
VSETFIYVIVPQDRERADWGFECNHVLRVFSPDSDKLLTSEELAIYSPFAAGTVLVFHSQAGDTTALFKLLGNSRARFLIHFGGDIRTNYYSTEIVAKTFREQFPGCSFDNHECFPFSGCDQEQFAWSQRIWDLNNSLSVRLFDFSTLPGLMEEIWQLADEYFNSQQPMRAMIEALFPLYLTLSEDNSKERSADRGAAVEATNKLLTSAAFVPIRRSISANAGEGMRLALDLTVPIQLERADDFKSWFLELSRAYTTELKLSVDADPFSPPSSTP